MLWLRQYRVGFGLMANFAFLSLFAPVLLFISFLSLLSGVRIIHYSPVYIERMSDLPPIPDTEPLSHPMSLADEIAKFSNDLNLSLDSNPNSPLPPSSPNSKALATANNASTSHTDSKLHTLGRLVHKVFEKVIPPQYLSTIDSQVHKFHQEINQTLQSLHTIVEAARKKDLNGENKDGNKQVWDSVEEQTNKLKLLEKELEKREAILTMTQQKMEELEEKLVEEMSKNQALSELYNTSHNSRRRVIEELATVKVTLDRVLGERNKLVSSTATAPSVSSDSTVSTSPEESVKRKTSDAGIQVTDVDKNEVEIERRDSGLGEGNEENSETVDAVAEEVAELTVS